MKPLYVACIVEGQGDIAAAPVLIKRLVTLVNPGVYADVRPFRVPKSKLVSSGELEKAVELAARRLCSPGVILVLIDSDDDCPKELVPALLARAMQTAGGRWPVGVVLAHREFECWFIAAAESAPSDPESIRGAKEWLRRNLLQRKYSETVDQRELADKLDLIAARRAPSFDKLYREIERFCSLAIPV